MTPIDEIDRQLNLLAETAARKVSRRQAMSRMFRGVVGATAALSVGKLAFGSDEAQAGTCCTYMCGQHCNAISSSKCPQRWGCYCPSGFAKCRSSDCRDCPYVVACWASTNPACGCNGRRRFCTDCKRLGRPCRCPHYCTCVSDC